MSNEMKMLELLPSLLPTFGNPIHVIEPGMNDGFHTGIIARILQQSGRPFVYVGLEPDPRLRPAIPPGVTFSSQAIGAKDGKATFFLSEGVSKEGHQYTGSSSLHPPSDMLLTSYPQMRFDRRIDVDTITYDTLCKGYGMDWVDFVWCDTQGCEGDLIAGGLEMMPKTKWFFTEYAAGELYLGQAVIDQIKASLPFMEVHTDWGGDILFKHRDVVIP